MAASSTLSTPYSHHVTAPAPPRSKLPFSHSGISLPLRAPCCLRVPGCIWLAYWWLDPMPPKHLTLVTGPEQSAYAEMGEQYAKLLRQQGITVDLVKTEGSADNLRKLQAGEADAGFVQGGSASVPSG